MMNNLSGQEGCVQGITAYEQAISSVYAPIKLESGIDDSHFYSSVDKSRVGMLNFTKAFASGTFRGVRNKLSMAAGNESLIVMLTLSGSFAFQQRCRSALCEPETVVLMDASSPIEAEQLSATEVLSVSFPLSFARSYYRNVGDYCAKPVSTRSGWGFLLKNFIHSVWEERASFSTTDVRKLPSLIAGFLDPVFISGEEEKALPGLSCAYLTEIERIIDERLQDPDLTPAVIAQALGVSVSYVYHLTRATGNTVGRMIMARRLEQCRIELADPAASERPITDIAFSWGFQELSHFSRRFSEKYGKSPSQYRKEVLRALCEG